MDHPFLLLAAIIALGSMYVITPVVLEAIGRYRKPRSLDCPDKGRRASINVDLKTVALTAVTGKSKLRVKNCSLWPLKNGCSHNCLAQCRY